jgi:hypothetical protein
VTGKLKGLVWFDPRPAGIVTSPSSTEPGPISGDVEAKISTLNGWLAAPRPWLRTWPTTLKVSPQSALWTVSNAAPTRSGSRCACAVSN